MGINHHGNEKYTLDYVDKLINTKIDAITIQFRDPQFYKKYNYKVEFVGHPLIDAIANREQVSVKDFRKKHDLGDQPIIALLPGSRQQEITKMLAVMLDMVDVFPDYKFVIAGAPSQDFSFYDTILGNRKVSFINN
ncbi:MAG: hypothetical protein ACKVIG_00955, partial [Flavobacteriales bacterium]